MRVLVILLAMLFCIGICDSDYIDVVISEDGGYSFAGEVNDYKIELFRDRSWKLCALGLDVSFSGEDVFYKYERSFIYGNWGVSLSLHSENGSIVRIRREW